MSADADEVAASMPGLIYAQQPITTPEAQGYARKFLDRNLSGANLEGEQGILDEMKTNSQQAIKALQRAQQNIQSQTYDPRLKSLAMAAGVLSPTRSGSTSEGLAAGFTGYAGELAKEQELELKKAELSAKYGLEEADEPKSLTAAKLELQKIHEQQEGPITKEALATIGKSIIPGGGALSPNARTAISEGYGPGTPGFYGRVRHLDSMDQRNHAATSGTDYGSVTEPDHSEQAYQFGVPETAPYPWTGASSKEDKQMKQTERQAALKQLQPLQDAVAQAGAIQRDLDRFGYLNKRTNTSSIQGVPGINFLTSFSDDHKEMDKISARLGPLMRQPGMGRMTNYDLQTFMAATVGRDKPKAVNDSIRTAMGTAIDNQLDYNRFMHSYFAVHKTLQGAPESWDDYLNANPIFDPQAEAGSFTLNAKRQKYREYFRSQAVGHSRSGTEDTGPSKFPDVTQTDRDDPVNAGLSDEEIHSAKQPAKARGGPFRSNFAPGGKVARNDDYQADLEDLARSLEQGASFQWGDEVNAALRPGSYASNVQNERGQQERFSSTHPATNTALEIGGGAASGAAAARAASAVLGRMSGKAGALGKVAGFLQRVTPKNIVAKTSLTGAGAGALAGAGSAQDVEHIPDTAIEQGSIGALTGPLAGLASKYGVNGVMALIDKARGRSINGGTQKVLDAMANDKTTVDEIGTRLRRADRLGVPSTVADVGGPKVQSLAQGVATKQGDQVDKFVGTLTDRNQGSNERVQELVNRALKPDDYTTKMEELTTNLYNNAKPMYQQAYAQFPKVKSDVIFDILATPSGKKAAKNAFKLMQDAGEPIGQADVTGAIRKPSLQYLDYVKRALDDQVNKAERSGATNQGRLLRDMRNRLKDELDTYTADPNGNSLYKQAREQYAGDLEVRDALELGRDKFASMSPRDLRNASSNMSWAEKDALRTGVAENLFQTISATPGSQNPAAKLANIPSVQQKLQSLFDKPADYNKFMDALNQEMQNFNQSRQVISTASRSRAAHAASSLDDGLPLGEAAYEATIGAAGHPLWAGARAAKWAGNKLMRPGAAGDAADVLGAGADPAGSTILARLKQQAALLQNRQSATNLAGIAGAAGQAPAMAPDPWGNLGPPQAVQ